MNHPEKPTPIGPTGHRPPAATRFKPFLVFIQILILAAALSGCGESSTDSGDNGNGSPGNGTPPGNGGDNDAGAGEVYIQGLSFSPSSRTVETGTTVTWTNQSNMVHTVTSGADRNHDGRFDSGNLSPGGTFTYTFQEPGTYPYFCRPHAGMSGTVIVEDPE